MSPSDSSNKLAYWLENGFLDSPRFDSTNISVGYHVITVNGLAFPKKHGRPHKRDSVWRTEAATDGPTEEYVFRAAVTLPSYTEMVTYGSKIKRERTVCSLTRSPYNAGHMYGVGDWNENTVHLSGSDVATDFMRYDKGSFPFEKKLFYRCEN